MLCTSVDMELFLVIHNIDGATLRNEKSQAALAMLAQSPLVHLIASIDHINAPLSQFVTCIIYVIQSL